MPQQPGTCPACGAAIIAEARFCGKCGQPINPTNQPVQAPHDQEQNPTIPVSPAVLQPSPPPANFNPTQIPPKIPPAQGIPPTFLNPNAENNPQMPPAPQKMETVLCAIGMVSRKTGLFSSVVYHLVVTEERLIFALQTKEMLAADTANARNQAKQQGKNIFGQIGAQMSTRSGDKYLGVTPDQILSENAQNFMIPLDTLKVIETYSGDFEDNSPDTMVVKTMNDKLTFTISHANSVLRELKPILGNKVK